MTPAPPATYYVPGEVSSPKFGPAFARGCRGPLYPVTHGYLPGHGYAGFCTPLAYPLRDRAEAAGEDWYYGDHAFYRRGKYFRVARNARQWVPTADDLRRASPDRFRALQIPHDGDWREHNAARTIVVCPNSPVYMAQFGLDAEQWVRDTVAAIAQVTDRPVLVRWKPQASRRPIGQDLHAAWAVVVYNSACALDALLVGLPVIVLCPWSTFRGMGSGSLADLDAPVRPDNADRHRFFWALAARQWTLDELADGTAWKVLTA